MFLCFLCISSLNLHAFYVLCHVSCLDLPFLHAYIFGATFLRFYAMFSLILCLFLVLGWWLGLCAHMLDIMSMVRPCLLFFGSLHCPYTLAHIKGFGSPILHVYTCLLLCFMLVLASLVLGFAMIDALSWPVVVWLHPMPKRPCLDATTWDASPWCRLLHAYLSPFPLLAMICLPCLFVPLVGFICIFTRDRKSVV